MIMTAFVNGGAGFLGGYICEQLTGFGWKVVSVGRGSQTSRGIEHLELNLPDEYLVKLIAERRPSLCVHCAGRASVAMSVTDPFGDFQCNSVLTASPSLPARLLRHALQSHPRPEYVLRNPAEFPC